MAYFEITYLILAGGELAIPGFLCKRLGLRGYCGKTLVPGVLDDRCDETGWGRYSNGNIGVLVSEGRIRRCDAAIGHETYCRMTSPSHAELASGTSLRARATALTMKSLTLSFAPFSASVLLNTSLSFKTLSMLISTVT